MYKKIFQGNNEYEIYNDKIWLGTIINNVFIPKPNTGFTKEMLKQIIDTI
jgi:hypothetical protein